MTKALDVTIENYSFNEHKHRYALWTAARSQRAFSNNESIAQCINATGVRVFAEQENHSSQEDLMRSTRHGATGSCIVLRQAFAGMAVQQRL